MTPGAANPHVIEALKRAANLVKNPEAAGSADAPHPKETIAVLDTQSSVAAASASRGKAALEQVVKAPPIEVKTRVLPDGRVIQDYKNVPDVSAMQQVQSARAEPYLQMADSQLAQLQRSLDQRDHQDDQLQREVEEYATLFPGVNVEQIKRDMDGFRSRAALARELGAGPVGSYLQAAKIRLGMIPRDRAMQQITGKRLNDALKIKALRDAASSGQKEVDDDRRQLAGTAAEIGTKVATSERQAVLDQIKIRNDDDKRLKDVIGFTDPANFESFEKYRDTVQGFGGFEIDEHRENMLRADYYGSKRKRAIENLGIDMKVEDQRFQQQAAIRAQEDQALQRAQFAITTRNADLAERRFAVQSSWDQKPPSEGERRAFGFYTRAEDATVQLDSLESEISGMGLWDQARLKFAPNVLQTDLGQLYTQASRQFTEARLRKDSGAAIAASEYEKDAKTYFAQPGDTKQTVERKRKARTTLLGALKKESGRAYTQSFGDDPKDPIGIRRK